MCASSVARGYVCIANVPLLGAVVSREQIKCPNYVFRPGGVRGRLARQQSVDTTTCTRTDRQFYEDHHFKPHVTFQVVCFMPCTWRGVCRHNTACCKTPPKVPLPDCRPWQCFSTQGRNIVDLRYVFISGYYHNNTLVFFFFFCCSAGFEPATFRLAANCGPRVTHDNNSRSLEMSKGWYFFDLLLYSKCIIIFRHPVRKEKTYNFLQIALLPYVSSQKKLC